MENKPDRHYWLHRITGGANALPVALRLLPKNEEEAQRNRRDFYISIGWSDFSTDDFVQNAKDNGLKVIEDRINKEGWPLSRNRYCLLRFIKEMKKGDYVIVPSSGNFSVYEIADDNVLSNQSFDIIYKDFGEAAPIYNGKYLFSKQGKNIDLGFYKRVVPIEINIPRAKYADPKLVRRMKIRQTNTQLDKSEFEEIINTAIQAYREKKPINLKANIIDKSLKTIFEELKKTVTSDRLEDVVGWYLEAQGADWIETPAKNASPTDQGDADRIACYEKFKLIVMVQVKNHDNTTEGGAIHQIQSYFENYPKEQGYTYLKWVISTCDKFSDEAKLLAEQNDVRLIDGKEFTQMILENGLNGMEI